MTPRPSTRRVSASPRPRVPPLAWRNRTVPDRTETAERRILYSRCGRYRLVQSRSLFGLPTRWYAMRRNQYGGWDTITMHRRRRQALAACERHARVAESRERRA